MRHFKVTNIQVIFANLLKEVKPQDGQGDRVMVLAHRKELVYQAAQRIQKANPGLSVSIEMERTKASDGASVVVASIPSLLRNKRLTKFNPQEFKLVIVDEVHHLAADSYWRIQQYFGADAPDTKVYVAGFSATLNRHDGQSLSRSLDYIAYHRGLQEMVSDGYLCPMELKQVKIDYGINYKSLPKREGDYSLTPLSRLLNTDDLNRLVVFAWKRYSGAGKDCKSALVFGVNIEHVEGMTREFRERGIDARLITSKTKPSVRDETLAAFKRGEFPVLVNCGILTEGTDIPNIDMIILNRPTKSGPLMLQMLGRGLRTAPGKKKCVLVDMFEASQYTQGMFTIPSLLGTKGYEGVKGVLEITEEELDDAVATSSKSDCPEISSVDVRRIDVDSYGSAIEYFSQADDVHDAIEASTLAFYSFANRFYLFGLNASARYLRVQRSKGKFEVVLLHERPNWRAKPFGRYYTRRIAACDSMFEAVKAVENLVSTAEKANFPFKIVNKDAKWRLRPVSKSQRAILDRLLWARSKAKHLNVDWPRVNELLSGQVSTLIALSHTGTTTCCDYLLLPPIPVRKTLPVRFESVTEGPLFP
jgi:ATP-dependent helicase IRC3